jgi:hypothetical protein
MLGRKIKNLIKGSVGKNWDEVYSKIKSYTIGLRFEHDMKWLLKGDICIPVWSCKFQRWEVSRDYAFISYNIELSEYIQRVRSSPRQYYMNHRFYYVCPISKKIRVVHATADALKKDADHWRRHYAFQKERKKKRKERKKCNDSYILRMINNPLLFEFYKSLHKEYKDILAEIDKYESMKKRREKHYNWYKPYPGKLQRLEIIKPQITELEAGNFNCFFESGIYLYSQQKECHHFAQP